MTGEEAVHGVLIIQWHLACRGHDLFPVSAQTRDHPSSNMGRTLGPMESKQ